MRRVLPGIFTALSLLVLSACGSAPTPETVPEPAPQEPEAPPEPTVEELKIQQIEDLLASLSLEEKVGQLFFVRCPADGAEEDIGAYHLGGYILFGRDYQDDAGNWLTRDQFVQTITGYQNAALNDTGIPLLIGSDEEGGTVTRASRNPNLFDRPFPSPQQLAAASSGADGAFAADARERSLALLSLGINVNLAPVCDVSTNPGDFIYDRTLGQDAQATAAYVSEVASAMRESGIGSVLKHFPGYGNNADTHTGIALDQRSMETFEAHDFLPFEAGLAAGEGSAAVLVNHNIVSCMDPDLPASLSPEVHRILREELGFDGVVMTDDLAMEAVASYSEDGAVAVMALEAGNDLIITTDYRAQIPKVLEAVERGAVPEAAIDTACRRVLTWKQNLHLLPAL